MNDEKNKRLKLFQLSVKEPPEDLLYPKHFTPMSEADLEHLRIEMSEDNYRIEEESKERDKKLHEWLNDKIEMSNVIPENQTKLADSHRLLLLDKLGILDLIKKELPVTDNINAYARLVGFILNVSPENIRHNIRFIEGWTDNNKHNPETERAINKLKNALLEVGIESHTIEKIMAK